MSESIGNVKSDAVGSGARFNDGKPNLALIPAWVIADVALDLRDMDTSISPESSYRAWQALYGLGRWQADEETRPLISVLTVLHDPLVSAARVFEYGAKKYAAWNWIKGMPWSVPLACAQRHALAMMRDEELDPESGLPHEGHLACNIIMLMQYEQTYREGDDITYQAIMPRRGSAVSGSPSAQLAAMEVSE